MTYRIMGWLIARTITRWFGPRCDEFEAGCPCCVAWACYDYLCTDCCMGVLKAKVNDKNACPLCDYGTSKLCEWHASRMRDVDD